MTELLLLTLIPVCVCKLYLHDRFLLQMSFIVLGGGWEVSLCPNIL